MAFIFQSEKKASIGPTNSSTPGPGQYIAHQDSKNDRGYAPFLSTVERGIVKKVQSKTPGPGSYDTVLSIENSLKSTKAFHASLSPEQDQMESNNLSTAFKSKTKRFEYKIDTDQPGPGMYYKDGGIGKSKSVSSLHAKLSLESPAQQIIKEERSVIPSIPSYTHSYGYSEGERRKLTLNKNPLLEIQEFVGPGYYDVKDTMTQNTTKGTTWHKSGTKRFESQASKLPTQKLGPGSYDQSNLDGAQPKYKAKQSSGFASTTGRTFDKTRGLTKSQSKGSSQFAIGFDIGKLSGVMDEGKESDFYTEESLPGPGHYHNEAGISSLKLNYKPTQFQFFGSGTERFKSEMTASEQLGPGEYNVQSLVAKKLGDATLSVKSVPEKKEPVLVPFQSTGNRFTTIKTPSLGPGIYDPKVNILDRVNDKARRGYLGSFGSTEIRFRPKKIPEETPEQARQREEDLHKQPELTEEQKKVSHIFVSKTNKITNSHKPPECPPPGAYDVNYYDIASKYRQEDGYFYNPKKTAFNSTDSRFKYKESEVTEPGSEDQRYAPRRNVVKLSTKNSQSAVFTSQTKRATSCLPRNGMPGPGAYQSLSQAGWLKKSFNIKFLDT